jgi:hypothetical protein
MIVQNSELLGEWEKNPGDPNEDTVGVIAASYKALAKPFRDAVNAALRDSCPVKLTRATVPGH